MKFEIVQLGEVLHLDLQSTPIDSETTYKMAGVYSFGRGLFRRDSVSGDNTSYKTFYQLKADHIVMSQLFGWEGALALSSSDFEGLFVSPQFPTFLCDEARLDRNFLGWAFRSPAFWEELGTRTRGLGVRRRTLNPAALFKSTIPLPSLDEQRRIVARVDELAAKIESARALRRETEKSTKAFIIATLHQILSEIPTQRTLGDSDVAQIICGQHLTPDEQGIRGTPYITGPADFGDTRPIPSRFATVIKSVSDKNDVLLTVKGAGVGKTNLAPLEKCVIGRQLFSVRPNPAILNQNYLWLVLRHMEVEVQGMATATTIPGIGKSQVENLQIPVPTLDEQQSIVSHLDALQHQIGGLRALQRETSAELDALLPSILDKAFKGEL